VAARAYWRAGGDPGLAVDHLVASLPRDPGRFPSALPVLTDMGTAAAPAIPALLGEAFSDEFLRADQAWRALAAIGDPALPAVRERLATSAELPTSAVLHFGEALREEATARGDGEAEMILSFMGGETPELLVLGADEADPLPQLRRRLADPGDLGRDFVFSALRRLGARAVPAVPDLVAFLDDETFRAEAADTLGAIGPGAAEAVPALTRYIQDPWTSGRLSVREALWRITGDERYYDLCPAELDEGDVWALPRLIAELGDGSPSWRLDVVRALARLGPAARPAAADLARIAADEAEDEYLRDAARDAFEAITR
jgi:hypothetical protein